MIRKYFKLEYEPFEIVADPSMYKIDTEGLVKKNTSGIYQANDKYIKRDDTTALITAIVSGGLGLAGVGFVLLVMTIVGEVTTLNDYYFLLPLFIASLFYFLMYIVTGRKYIILDRQNGVLSYPQHFFKKEPISIDFDDARILISYESQGSALGTKLSIENRIPGSLLNGYWMLQRSSEREYWSFMVWYMDKNRPLPPGTAFDAYRQQDFERRKAEGFPPPLYPSIFDTKEATAEQQAQRKKIGGW